MEHLERQLQGHDRRIADAEKRLHEMEIREAKRDSEMKVFKVTMDNVDLKVNDLKDNLKSVTTAVKEDGDKTRASNELQQTSVMSLMNRMMDRVDNLDGQKEAAATREHETKRTKWQVVKDISIAALALIGTVVGATVAYQELIAGFFK